MNTSDLKKYIAVVLLGDGEYPTFEAARADDPDLNERDYLSAHEAYLQLRAMSLEDAERIMMIARMIGGIAQDIQKRQAEAVPAVKPATEAPTESLTTVSESETVASLSQESLQMESLIDQACMTGGQGLQYGVLAGWSRQDLEIERNAYQALKALGKRSLPYLRKHAHRPPIDKLIMEIEARQSRPMKAVSGEELSSGEEQRVASLVARIHNPIVNTGDWRDAKMMGFAASQANFDEAERAAEELRRMGARVLRYLPTAPQNKIMDKLLKDLAQMQG